MVDPPVGGYKGLPNKEVHMGNKRYSEEFKAGAVNLVVEQGLTVSAAAKRLGVNYHTLRDWVQGARLAAPETLIPRNLPQNEEVLQLRKENARLRMEREILKKATAFFAKEHP
jgi:transposase